jgi:hypothetical protein
MPPRTKEDEGRPWTYGLKLRTKAGSPDPVATRHLCAGAAVVAASMGAAEVACTMRTVKRAAALTMPRAPRAVRLERTEIFTFPAFLSAAGKGAEGFVLEPLGVVFDLRGTVVGVLLRERLTGRSGAVKAWIGVICVDTALK